MMINLSDYKRTDAGNLELMQRQQKLNARTRTLLLLLEKDELKQLSFDARGKIASAENFQNLLDLGLIINIAGSETASIIPSSPSATNASQQLIQKAHASNHIDKLDSEKFSANQSTSHITKSSANIQPDTAQAQPEAPSPFKAPTKIKQHENNLAEHDVAKDQHSEKAKIHTINFDEVKTLMQHTLQQYAGLMAKRLVVAIAEAESTQQLRQHQSKWLTSLFETRISRQQLNELLAVINASLEQIDQNAMAS